MLFRDLLRLEGESFWVGARTRERYGPFIEDRKKKHIASKNENPWISEKQKEREKCSVCRRGLRRPKKGEALKEGDHRAWGTVCVP